jgi:hypothetical protein
MSDPAKKTQIEPDTQESPAKAAPTRDEIRAAVFGAKPESKVIEDFFGQRVELKQPTLGRMLEMRAGSQQDATFEMLLNYTFVPGTETKVFEEADRELVQQLPFGKAMQEFINSFNELVGVDAKALEGLVANAMKRPGDGTSEDNGDVNSGGAA